MCIYTAGQKTASNMGFRFTAAQRSRAYGVLAHCASWKCKNYRQCDPWLTATVWTAKCYDNNIAGSSRCDHVTSLLSDHHWLPVKQRVEYKLCMMVYCCLYGDAPSYLADLITPSAAATVRPGLRSAASSTVAVPWTTSLLGDRSFAAAGPRAWNKLPPLLRHVYSAATFKRQLKTFLYNHAFNSHC